LGKRYSFKERGTLISRGQNAGNVFRYFKDTEVKNYPIQGTAGDLVSLQVGNVFQFAVKHQDKFLMINEVHDSLILDVRKEHLDFILPKVTNIMEDVQTSFRKHFDIDFNVPIKVDAAIGANWLAAKLNG
jgi:DNA polymerase I-like protein with 3'-5' exonuclease and polymerase domains